MSTTSMSLESLQFLLQHMDANRRLEVSKRCPSLRDLEKSVPLQINSLTLSEHAVTINDKTYQMGIIRKYNVGEAPKLVELENQEGGVPHEVDRYGFEDKSDATTVTPGDVELNKRPPGMRVYEMNDERLYMIILKYRIQDHEAQLVNLQERRPNGSHDDIKNILEADRAKLFACECRQTSIPPNFDNFLQLTTSTRVGKFEQKTIERHNKKFSEVVKQLNTVLFGGRTFPIHVKKMNFLNGHMHWVIRLPENVKFRVDYIRVFGSVEKTFEALAPIIHESSFPLKQVELSLPGIEDVSHPIVRAAGILNASMFVSSNFPVLFSITNPRVHVRSALPPWTLASVLENWMESKLEIGTEHIFDYGGEPWFMDEMEDVLKALDGVPIDNENVVFPINNAAQLRLSYGQFPKFAPFAKFAVKFLTKAIEH